MAPTPPREAEQSFVDTPHCRVRVWRGGSGPPLVIVADCGDALEMWSDAFVDVARDHEVLLIEQPGFGYSDAGRDFDYRWHAHLEALRSTVDQLGVAGAAGVGHCVGGTQLLALTHERPALLDAVVLAETFPAARYADLGINMLMHRVAAIRGVGELFLRFGGAGGIRSGSRHLLATLGAGKAWVTDDLVDRHVGSVIAGHNARGGLLHIRRWDGTVAQELEDGASLPATYLFGGAGRFARHLEERRAHAQTVGRDVRVLPGAGHFLFAEQPGAFSDEVRTILDDLAN